MTFRTNQGEHAVVDYDNPANNMYGCAPCPRCGESKRAAYRRPYGPDVSRGLRIECDDCGHHEWAWGRSEVVEAAYEEYDRDMAKWREEYLAPAPQGNGQETK